VMTDTTTLTAAESRNMRFAAGAEPTRRPPADQLFRAGPDVALSSDGFSPVTV
jgi:hypothetical protein